MVNEREKGSGLIIKLKLIKPFVPTDSKELESLEKDLTRMGCIGFRKVLWDVHDKKMLRELVTGASNKFDHTIWSKHKTWTVEHWRETYEFA